MSRPLTRFTKNDILSLTESAPRYDLAESVGPDLRLGALLDDDADLSELALGYGTAAGDPELRRMIAAAHGVTPEDVVVTVGGMQALFLLGLIFCERGDEAVITAPVFPNAREALASTGAAVKTLRLSFEDGYRLDPDALAAKLSPRTRLVSLASPQNPSGVAIPLETIERVLAHMKRICPNAALLVDETYREATYGDAVAAPSAVGLSHKVVSCASLSKCHGAPGLRIGWAITRDEVLREQLVLGKFNSVIACSTIDEALARRVLERREDILAERRGRLAHGLALTEAWVRRESALVDWVKPDAGALCCVRLRPDRFDAAAVKRFHETAARNGARVASGAWFGDEPHVFRLGFGLPPAQDLEAGLDALSKALHLAAERVAA